MPSHTVSLGLLSLAASALAVPYSSGSWPSYPSGTGAPYPLGNNTVGLPPSGQPRHQRHSTAPAAGSETSTITNTLTDYSTVVYTVYATAASGSGSGLVNAAAATESACTTTPTVTQTVTNKVYVTVTPGQSSAASSSSSSAAVVAPVASSASSASSASVNVAQYSSAASSSAPAYSTASSVVSSAAASSTAAASSSSTPSSSASSTSSAASSTSTSSGTKRGIAYNDNSLIAAFSGTQTSWCYNWGQTSGGSTDGNTYIPMLWNASSDEGTIGYERTQSWESNAKTAISNGATELFTFNEPDLDTQANMSPSEAATQYKTWVSDLFSSAGVTLVAPAVTNGGGDMGLTWMKNFLSACSDCKVDAVAIHWYNAATDTDDFKTQVSNAHTESGNLPVYVTEFAPTGTDDEVENFLETVLPWLDSQDYVAKYSYYMAADGDQYLNSGTGLSAIGETYAKYTG